MAAYLIKRLLQGALVLAIVSFLTFTVMFFMPGDPARTMVGQARVTEEQLETIREKWGLNDPWYVQYWTWITNLLRGDLGDPVVESRAHAGRFDVDDREGATRTGLQTLQRLNEEAGIPADEDFIAQGAAMLERMREEGTLLGTLDTSSFTTSVP